MLLFFSLTGPMPAMACDMTTNAPSEMQMSDVSGKGDMKDCHEEPVDEVQNCSCSISCSHCLSVFALTNISEAPPSKQLKYSSQILGPPPGKLQDNLLRPPIS